MADPFGPPRHVDPFVCCASSNAGLVANLRAHGVFSHDAVESALLATDRKLFAQEHLRVFAYGDSPSPLSPEGVSMSAPHLHAACLQAVVRRLVQPGSCVALDVGCGSGFLAAALAHIINSNKGVEAASSSPSSSSSSSVLGVDISDELVHLAEENCRKACIPDLFCDDDEEGCGSGTCRLHFSRCDDILSEEPANPAAAAADSHNSLRGQLFDVIVAGMQLPDQASLKALARHLRPGGGALMVVGFDGALVLVENAPAAEAVEHGGGERRWVLRRLYEGAGMSPAVEATTTAAS